MAFRSITVAIENQSSVYLKFQSERLRHGTWAQQANRPTSALAGETVRWRSESDGVLTGTTGEVVYQVGESGVHRLSIRWGVPAIGSAMCIAECTSAKLVVTRTRTGSGDLDIHVLVKDAPLQLVEPPQTPALLSTDDRNLEVFVLRGRKIHTRSLRREGPYYDATDWGRWWSELAVPPEGVRGGLAGISWGPDHRELAVINGSGELAVLRSVHGGWGTWDNLGGNFVGTPSLASRGPGHLVAACRDAGGGLWLVTFADGGWREPVQFACPPFASPPAAVWRTRDDAWAASGKDRRRDDMVQIYGVTQGGEVIKVVVSDPLAGKVEGYQVTASPEALGTDGGSAVASWDGGDEVDLFLPSVGGKVMQIHDGPTGIKFDRLRLMSPTAPSAVWMMPGDLHVVTYDLEGFARHQRFFDRVWFEADVVGSPTLQCSRREAVYPLTADWSGWVEVAWNADGDVRFSGQLNATDIWNYNISLIAMLATDAGVHVMLREGAYVDDDGPDGHSWTREENYPLVRAAFADFLDAALIVETQESEDVAVVLEELGGFVLGLVAFLVVGAALAAATAAVAVIAVPLAQLGVIDKNDLNKIIRVSEGVIGVMGPFGSLVAWSLSGFVLGEERRQLSTSEYAAAVEVFDQTLPPRESIWLTNTSQTGSGALPYRAFVFPQDGRFTVNMGPHWDHPLDYGVAEGAKKYGQTFIHELVHVWQLHNSPDLQFFWRLWKKLIDAKSDAYDYGDLTGVAWPDLGIEEQAAVVDNWYIGADTSGGVVVRPRMDPSSPLYRFITDNLRTGQPE